MCQARGSDGYRAARQIRFPSLQRLRASTILQSTRMEHRHDHAISFASFAAGSAACLFERAGFRQTPSDRELNSL